VSPGKPYTRSTRGEAAAYPPVPGCYGKVPAMFERFTEDARRIVFEARHLAITRGDDRVGPLHMLSALTSVSSGANSVAARVLAARGVDEAAVARLLGSAPGAAPGTVADAEALASIGIDLDEIRRKVEENFGEGALDRVPAARGGPPNLRGPAALTDDARSTLAMALREAIALQHNYIGTEHILLGLLRTADSAGKRGRRDSGLRQAMTTLGLGYPAVRDQVVALLATA
jgi:ATP-dependent Clp protease ATP-binding subunit ClpA